MDYSMLGLIYTGESDSSLRELTSQRAVAAVPFAGRYRMIDFSLSSMVASGIRNVGVIVQRNYQSLMDHLGSGREWNLHGKRSGLVILPPFLTKDNVGVYEGFLDALRSNLHFLRKSKERYAVVTDSRMLYTANFDEMVRAHAESGADITLLYTRDPNARRNGKGRYIDIAENGMVKNLESDPTIPHYPNTYMEAFVIRRELLIDLVARATAQGQHHLVRELLINGLQNGSLKIGSWECPGNVWSIDSVQAYFACSMDMLNSDVRRKLFYGDTLVLTKLRDEMPARYVSGSKVSNSLVADGCVIEGTVENSILFRGVHVEKGAVVKNCIVMQEGIIMKKAELENCILDKQSTVLDNTRLIGAKSYPIVIAKDSTI